MAITYSWIISQLECYPEHEGKTDVVVTIHWRRHAEDGEYVAEAYGMQPLTLDPGAPFTPYDQITKEQVEGWLISAMGAERVDEINAALARQIADMKVPPIVAPPLPWSN